MWWGVAIKVSLNPHFIKRLRTVGDQVLPELGPLTEQFAQGVRSASLQLVPVSGANPDTDKNPPLITTSFVTGPVVNPVKKSISSTCGYEHPAAGAIHEGVHWGVQTQSPPPHFLRKPARKGRAALKKAIAKQLQSTVSRIFPPK